MLVIYNQTGVDPTGVTSSSSAIETLIDGVSGGAIHFQSGTYYLPTLVSLEYPVIITSDPDVIFKGPQGVDDDYYSGFAVRADAEFRDLHFTAGAGIRLATKDVIVDSLLRLSVQNCRFVGGLSGISDTTSESTAVLGKGFREVLIERCDFEDLEDGAIEVTPAVILEARVLGNKITNAKRMGIRLGNNLPGDVQPDRRKLVVSHNNIEGLRSMALEEPEFGPVNAILVYGEEVTISHNTVVDCWSQAYLPEGEEDPVINDCEGIYTKAAFSNVVGNVVFNSGNYQAAINVKGRDREAIQTLDFSNATATTFKLTYDAVDTGSITVQTGSAPNFATMAADIETELNLIGDFPANVVFVATYSTKLIELYFPDLIDTWWPERLTAVGTGGTAPEVTYSPHKGYATLVLGNVVRSDTTRDYQMVEVDSVEAPYYFPMKGINAFNEDVVIVENYVEGTMSGIGTTTGDDCKRLTIARNTVRNIKRDDSLAAGIYIASKSANISILDNRVDGVTSDPTKEAIGIRCERLGDSTEIRGNRVRNLDGSENSSCVRMILEENVDRLVLEENIFEDTAVGWMLTGKNQDWDLTNAVVLNNKFYNVGLPYKNTAADSVVLVNPVIKGNVGWPADPVSITIGSSTTATLEQASAHTLLLTGTLTTNRNLTLPYRGEWVVKNQTSGGYTVTVKATAMDTGITVGNAKTAILAGDTSAITRITADV